MSSRALLILASVALVAGAVVLLFGEKLIHAIKLEQPKLAGPQLPVPTLSGPTSIDPVQSFPPVRMPAGSNLVNGYT